MESFVINGGYPLKGSITPQGAKNEALQILCAVLLTSEKITVHNIPDIIDVNKLISLIENFGVKVESIDKGSYSFIADNVNIDYLKYKSFEKNWPNKKQQFIEDKNKILNVFQDGIFKTELFEQLIFNEGLYDDWPKTKTGK